MGEFAGFALVPEQGITPEKEQLDAAMQARIEAMAARINLRDSAAVLGFGARAQKEMAAFSDIALAQMMRGDIDPLGSVMQELAGQIRACSFAAEARGFFGRMMGKAAPLAQVRRAYEQAEPKISACADEMLSRRVALMNDGALLERLYERNETLYRELCSLIVIGDEAVRQAAARAEDTQLIARMERRVQDLRVTQTASSQLAAQIRMVQSSGKVACERIKTALDVTIPLWKSQMAAALGLARATDTLRMQGRMETEAMRGIRAGTSELRAQKNAYTAAGNDRDRAQQTAQTLLAELEEIERSLRKNQENGFERSV